MKLATFEWDNQERWGIVLNNPHENRLWVYEPAKVDRQLQLSATTTNGYAVSMPKFMPDSKWPDTLVDFLKLEEEGMNVLRRLESFLKRFLEQSDEARMCFCGHPLEEVHLRAPIPRPRLMWGLVQNCPTFVRSNPRRTSSNLFPQGHQRPAGAVVGSGEYFVHPADGGSYGFNVELGVVIGKKGRYIPVNEAMNYVAGYTVVTDSSTDGFAKTMNLGSSNVYEAQAANDWYVGATMSWGGKMTDAHCAMGPFLTTRDEIGNVYDLLVYTKMNGRLRDRAHTSALLLGVERVIQWYSSFATLYPGDVLHLGTMGTDGLKMPTDFAYNGKDQTIDSEIERVGYLQTPVLNLMQGDWRDDADESRRIHESPAIRDLVKAGKSELQDADAWSVGQTPHFYTLFKNYERVTELEGIRKLDTPRFLCAPASALGENGAAVELPPRCNDLEISVELAAVIKKVAKGVTAQTADEYLLGYMTLVSLTDSSFDDILVEPTTLQEKGLPLVYGRWADGFNVVSGKPTAFLGREILGRRMTLRANGQTAQGSTDEYVCAFDRTLPFITKYITLFPGDVVTLGCIAQRITLKKDEILDGMKIEAEIDGLPPVSFSLRHSLARDNSIPVNQLKL